MQVINAYFKSVPDDAVEIRKFYVADWYANPNSIVNAMRCLYGPDCVIDFIYVP